MPIHSFEVNQFVDGGILAVRIGMRMRNQITSYVCLIRQLSRSVRLCDALQFYRKKVTGDLIK